MQTGHIDLPIETDTAARLVFRKAKEPLLKRIAAALVALTLCVLVAATAALSAGGHTIGTAPVVSFGAQTFGNTTAGATEGCCSMYEYWRVNLIAGDHVKVKFENGAPSKGVNTAYLYEAGTDDFNIEDASYESEDINSNGHAQLDFDAPTSGVYPLIFYSYNEVAGAYDFTTTVVHQARLRLETSRVARAGRLAIEARYPDGSKVTSGLGATLYGFWAKGWHKLGKAAVANGVIRIRYRLPAVLRGQKLKLRASAGGPSFKGVRISRLVTVA